MSEIKLQIVLLLIGPLVALEIVAALSAAFRMLVSFARNPDRRPPRRSTNGDRALPDELLQGLPDLATSTLQGFERTK